MDARFRVLYKDVEELQHGILNVDKAKMITGQFIKVTKESARALIKIYKSWKRIG